MKNELSQKYKGQSDVDAGRMAGSVLYQLIRNHERFIGQLARARAEFAEKTGVNTSCPGVAKDSQAQQQSSSTRVYRLDGTPADDASHGVLIQNSQKFVKK